MKIAATWPSLRSAAGIAALLALGTGSASIPSATRTTLHIVRIQGMTFEPATLAVRRGERIVWKNDDLFAHTATAQDAFDSGSIAGGATWTLVAEAIGTFAYTCSLHPTMHGILIVR